MIKKKFKNPILSGIDRGIKIKPHSFEYLKKQRMKKEQELVKLYAESKKKKKIL